MGYSTLELCASGGAFEAVPRPRQPLNLARVRERFEQEGILVVDARVMLIIRTSPEATISRDGRIVLKTRDRQDAERMFDRILMIAGVPPRSPAPRSCG